MTDGPTDRLHRILALKQTVFDEWTRQLRAQIPKARKLPEPLLVDTLPLFYETLAKIATCETDVSQRSTLAEEHGGERARLTRFHAETIVFEFQLFRSVVLTTWDAHQISLSLSEIAALNHAIDEAVAESVAGFVMVEERFREQFFSALTHDLRTPLGTAAMAVEMIGQVDDPARIRQLVQVAQNQHALLSQMITDLLDTVVAGAGSRVAIDLESMNLLDIAQEVARSAELTYRRTVLVEGAGVNGFWCKKALRRALENLVSNAIKYGHSDTPVTIRLEEFAGRGIISVQNFGSPIPIDQQETIFQLFRRAEIEMRKGSSGWGIGLPYVRSIAEQHGGSISLESTDGKTTFFVDIPIDPRPILGQLDG